MVTTGEVLCLETTCLQGIGTMSQTASAFQGGSSFSGFDPDVMAGMGLSESSKPNEAKQSGLELHHFA